MVDTDTPAEHVTPLADAWARFRHHRLAVISLVVLTMMMVVVALGPIAWQVSIGTLDLSALMEGPSLAHPFGTDNLGRDLLARMLYGGRISMAVGFAAMFVSVAFGTLIGALAGSSRGIVDVVLMWFTDLFLSLPQLPMLLLVIYIFRDPLKKLVGIEVGVFLLVILVIGGFNWMSVARLVRSQFLSLREKEFVEAARAIGASPLRQVIRHILPNALGPVIVAATMSVAHAIIAESSLSFLGLGFPPDTPTWGRLLLDGKDLLDMTPHLVIFPGVAIFVVVLAINFTGDGLRDAFDPRKVL